MPGIETASLKQWAVLWPLAGVDGYGQKTVGQPTEVRCRWNRTHTESQSSQTDTTAYDAQVVVGVNVEIGSLMWLGTLAELGGFSLGEDSPGGPLRPRDGEIMEVKSVATVPDIKARKAHRQLGLMRYKDAVGVQGTGN